MRRKKNITPGKSISRAKMGKVKGGWKSTSIGGNKGCVNTNNMPEIPDPQPVRPNNPVSGRPDNTNFGFFA